MSDKKSSSKTNKTRKPTTASAKMAEMSLFLIATITVYFVLNVYDVVSAVTQFVKFDEVGRSPIMASAEEYYREGVLYKDNNDIEQAGYMLGEAAKLGSDEAAYILEQSANTCRSLIADVSDRSVPDNAADRLDLCHLLASSGDADTQVLLGALYYRGSIVRKDKLESFRWFYRAAAQGHVFAQYKVLEFHARAALATRALGDLAIVYGWACVLDKQSRVPNSPGIAMWEKEDFAVSAQSLKTTLDSLASESLIYGIFLKATRKYFLSKFYRSMPISND